jgi:diguanylate cyclase (GGDEF)-like protein/PAS domain S-box-containing protein
MHPAKRNAPSPPWPQADPETLRRDHELIAVTLRSIADAVVTTDATGRISYMNPAAERLSGFTLQEARAQRCDEILLLLDEHRRRPLDGLMDSPLQRCLGHGGVQSVPEGTLLLGGDGREFFVQGTASPICDDLGNVFGVVLVLHDVSEQRRLNQELVRQAQEDALTALPNRREFEARVASALTASHARGAQHALLYLDLDHFKVVNDTCGHAAGDELLRDVARLLAAQVRQHDTVARLGGDEFGILLENCPLEAAQKLAEKVRTAVEAFRFHHGEERFQIGISLGLAGIDAGSASVAEVLRQADSALYAAKHGGRNRVHLFHADDGELAQRHGELRWVQRIQDALEQDHFVLHAQPIVGLTPATSDDGVRLEVLLRMRQEEERLILPDGFMPAAERYHQAVAVDRWVVEHVLACLSTHRDALARLQMCCINLSGQSLGDRLFHAFISRKLQEHDIPAHKLCFELTETAAIASLGDARRFMETMQGWGCRFALDDFGSGLSSFGYLRELPVDMVKIDGLFVRDMAHDAIDLAMVRAINDVAHLMDKPTVAEWVETGIIADELRRLGVDYGQGFHLAPPRPLELLLEELAESGTLAGVEEGNIARAS